MPAKKPDLAAVHAKLKNIMQKYEGDILKASPDQPGHYVLIGPPTERSKGKQGKSCFNFKQVDDKLFKELAKLTDKGHRRFKKEKLIG